MVVRREVDEVQVGNGLAFLVGTAAFEADGLSWLQAAFSIERKEGNVAAVVVGRYDVVLFRAQCNVTRGSTLRRLGVDEGQGASGGVEGQCVGTGRASVVFAYAVYPLAVLRYSLVGGVGDTFHSAHVLSFAGRLVEFIDFDTFLVGRTVTSHQHMEGIRSGCCGCLLGLLPCAACQYSDACTA